MCTFYLFDMRRVGSKRFVLYSFGTKCARSNTMICILMQQVLNQSLTSCHHLRQDMPMSESSAKFFGNGSSWHKNVTLVTTSAGYTNNITTQPSKQLIISKCMKVCRLYACMYIHMYSNVQGYCTSRIRRRNHCASKVYSHAEHALHSASSVTQLSPTCNDTDTKQ